MSIGVNLELRNEAQLQTFIAQVSDRKSPNYGHYLTPDQFVANYAPTQTQVQQVIDQLRASGLSVSSVSSNRTIVDASGPVSAVEAAFGVTISDWHDRDQNRDFFGNDTEPTLPAAIASYVVGVAGLNNHYPLHRLGSAPKVGGTGPAGGYTPNELKKAYDVIPLASAGYTGSGQALGLLELDGFRQSNITTYDMHYGLGSPAPSTVLVDGGPGPLGAGEIEVELDIEVMHAIAPAAPITVWEGPNTNQGVNDTYNAMVTSNTTKSNSTSWGICEPQTTQAEMTTLDNIFKQGAAQGQSFFAASGDYGAYDCGDNRLTVDSPASDPYITAAGGTTLTLNADGTYKSESVWSNPNAFPTPTGSGGGLSSYFARPSWQTGPGVANTYSNGKRQVPDISSDADPNTGYSVYITNGGTGWTVVGGTSAAAPSWAALTGVYNQYAAANGKPNLGLANPTLYSAGSNAQPYAPYHDVTSGDNLYYAATPNWDYATGWGSYDGYNFARDLAGPYWNAAYDVANTPTSWAPLQTQIYGVTVTNTGNQTWPAGGANPVHLGVHFAGSGGGYPTGSGAGLRAGWYADQRITLPSDVAPGASLPISVSVTAPNISATKLVVEYQMVKEYQFWFGQFADVSQVTVGAGWGVGYNVINTPTTWSAMQIQTYTVTISNIGTQTWPAGGSNPVHLGVHFAAKGGGYAAGSGTGMVGGWYNDQRITLPSDVAPGASLMLSVVVAAPNVSGANLALEYELVKENEFWFGQFADVGQVTVAPGWGAGYTVGNTPASWSANQTQAYSVTVTNTGSRSWPAGGADPTHLGIHFAANGGGYAAGSGTAIGQGWYTDQRVILPSDVAPGASLTLSVVVTAPNITGTLVVEYEMVRESEFWFGQSAGVAVGVK